MKCFKHQLVLGAIEVGLSLNTDMPLHIAPFLSPEVEAGAVDFLSSAFLLALEPNNIPANTAKAPATMAYMNT
jgi:hypothetical protein